MEGSLQKADDIPHPADEMPFMIVTNTGNLLLPDELNDKIMESKFQLHLVQKALSRHLPIFLTITLTYYLTTLSLSAHPGLGFAKDSKGNLYYTDLKQIWKQSIDGSVSVAVPNVHSHEIWMDKHDRLFGEHLWYVSCTEIFLWYGWRLDPDGKLHIVRTTDTAFVKEKDYSLVRDSDGYMYWYVAKDNHDIDFIKSDSIGNKSVIAKGIYKNIRWMYCSPENEIYFLDAEDLYKISAEGHFICLAKNLAQGNLMTAVTDNNHSVFGIWFDDQKNIYAAVTADHCVKKISADGRITNIYLSPEGNAPVGGLFDREGNMWVLETVGLYDARIVKISAQSVPKSSLWFRNNWLAAVLTIAILVFLYCFIKKKKSTRLFSNSIFNK